ncbi:putative G-protein coupled receptor Mth-like 5 [Pseudolycoriella hygida]|uniref:G-protein coupled receptor Mth-like 5 n=1 Tax=Pseudolycoriella hygida TaxID=35572 RepID=A0A9Q0MWZ5_9DIPT|nr:putative G-protein coupled receptor Mth-like 5 [Pseudolycoriella hygida]
MNPIGRTFMTFGLYILILNKYLVMLEKHGPNAVRVNKCCEKNEILVDLRCTTVNSTSGLWQPIFTGYDGRDNVQVGEFWFAVGVPDCGPMQMWPVYHYQTSRDKLNLLPDGKLRHYIKNPYDEDDFHEKHLEKDATPLYYDYEQGQYCMDKAVSTTEIQSVAQFAMVCSPEKAIHWTDTDFLLRKIINSVCHGLSICILLIVAIIYFILPTLRDLVGNIITTITVCLIVSQAANLVRIFTEFSSHVSFMIADIVLYVGLLGAFFWLNSLGYYIWRTFRSRNVFLRVTDGRKYCWYSAYAWSATGCMASFAVFAHFYLDSIHSKKRFMVADQETIGWLGIVIFFTPIACTILIDIFFYVTTMQIINRMNTYGRIHHKLKSSFIMFSLLLLVMSVSWLFLLLSWLDFDGLLYAHIIVNSIQAPLILYICVLRQKHVKFLLKKTCCYNEPPSASDWGDEMAYMNDGNYNY